MLNKILAILFIMFCMLLSAKSSYAAILDLDQTYGTNGKTVLSFGKTVIPTRIAQQTDGKTVVSGYMDNGNNFDWVVLRININGQLDNTFGIGGKFVKDFGGSDGATSLAVQSDGKIVIGGFAEETHPFTWKVVRLNTDGSLDPSFGNGGISTQDMRGYINKVVIGSDQKITAIGYFLGINNGNDDVALVRYNTDGSLDINFGQSGSSVFPINGSNDRGKAAQLQSDGKIIIAGDFDAGGYDDVYVSRVNADGSLDSSFGTQGKVIMSMEGQSSANDIIQQPDGKILITGSVSKGGNGDTYVIRLSSLGALDNSFGENGVVIRAFSPGLDFSSALALQANGQILAAGGEDASGHYRSTLRIFDNAGVLNSDYGSAGSFVIDFNNKDSQFSDLKIQQDGKVIAVADNYNGQYYDIVILRLSDASTPSSSIPLIKQTNPLWASDIYDSANLWSAATGMDRWGCAVTSAVMVFQSNALLKMPGGIVDLTPGTVNVWLKNAVDGYVRNGLVNWLALSRLSRLASHDNSVSFDALEYSRINKQDDKLLGKALAEDTPPIVQVPGHFVVGTGTDSANTTFFINDPYYDRLSLADGYNKSYLRFGTYTPVNSDLSYIMLVVNPNVNISLVDENGILKGESIIEDPIKDPLGLVSNSKGAVKTFYFKKPQSGKYTLKLSSQGVGAYTLDEYLYDINGNVKKITNSGNLENGTVDTYVILFDKNNSSSGKTDKITFDFIKQEIITGYGQKKIKSILTYAALVTEIELAKKSKSKVVTKGILDAMLLLIKNDKKGIDTTLSSILINDILDLKKSI